MVNKSKYNIGIIGLGYVGLPLAVEFSKKYPVIGFDINLNRINQITKFNDITLEITKSQLSNVIKTKKSNNSGLYVTNILTHLKNCNIYIITVPTPIDKHNRPLLTPLLKASQFVGTILKNNDYVIYESTVYPGATENDCVKVLEKFSNLKFNKNFYVGYSPERINPGDKEHTVSNILKLTSGSTPDAANYVDNLYKSIIKAGTYKTSSIKVAEAAKVIENSQRDINIAFVNELSKIFNLMNIDTLEVLKAASTKWNFLNFKPGLVGGHCIGVDPYYLSQKAQEYGYNPEIILAGRRINDGMGKHVASESIKLMIKKNITIKNSYALILGFTFKENCTDIRNTRVIDIYNELVTYGIKVNVYDPIANKKEVKIEYNIDLIEKLNLNNLKKNYSLIILAVAHDQFLGINIKKSSNKIIFDIKGFLNKKYVDARL
jgi:UDP-N-acetyl-D-galactosamine dehydrogenase